MMSNNELVAMQRGSQKGMSSHTLVVAGINPFGTVLTNGSGEAVLMRQVLRSAAFVEVLKVGFLDGVILEICAHTWLFTDFSDSFPSWSGEVTCLLVWTSNTVLLIIHYENKSQCLNDTNHRHLFQIDVAALVVHSVATMKKGVNTQTSTVCLLLCVVSNGGWRWRKRQVLHNSNNSFDD
jgi:hypothetical protein